MSEDERLEALERRVAQLEEIVFAGYGSDALEAAAVLLIQQRAESTWSEAEAQRVRAWHETHTFSPWPPQAGGE